MSLTCPVDLDTLMLRREISAMYARVATAPEGEFHFHRGAAYASDMLGYDLRELERLPAGVTARFAGVGNPHAVASLATGATVVDIGCGGGMDLLLAALHVGPAGRAIGVDMLDAEIVAAFRSSGFDDVSITHRFDCFAGTTKERTARRYGVVGVNLSAMRSVG